MATTPPITQLNPTGGATKTDSTNGKKSQDAALRDLDVDQFLKLMIAELQNQDPLNPTDNQAILEQINTIRNIGATDKMTETLSAVLVGQTLSNAATLIGKQIDALTDDGKTVQGKVDSVSVVDGTPQLHVGDKKVRLDNLKSITGETGAASN